MFLLVPVASCHRAPLQWPWLLLRRSSPHIDLLIRSTLIHLLCKLNSSSFLSLSPYVRCSSPYVIFMTICWTLSSMSISVLYRITHHQIQHSRYVSPELSSWEGSPPQPAAGVLPTAAPDAAGLLSTAKAFLPHGQSLFFPWSSFVKLPSACTSAWSCFFQTESSALPFADVHGIPISPFLQPVPLGSRRPSGLSAILPETHQLPWPLNKGLVLPPASSLSYSVDLAVSPLLLSYLILLR